MTVEAKKHKSKYRKVDPRIWNDAKFRDLSDSAKLVFFMLLTHPGMTALGAMRATLSGLAEELGWEPQAFREAFGEALAKGMAKHDKKACLIALPNFLKYNQPESPNVVRAWGKSADLLPECTLKTRVIAGAQGYLEGLSEGYRKAFAETFTHPSLNQEQEQEQDIPVGEAGPPNVWNLWTECAGNTRANRSFLGKQIKTYGDEKVAQAVATLATRRPPPAEPCEFLVGMLRDNTATEELL